MKEKKQMVELFDGNIISIDDIAGITAVSRAADNTPYFCIEYKYRKSYKYIYPPVADIKTQEILINKMRDLILANANINLLKVDVIKF
jgi:hypothetical protein